MIEEGSEEYFQVIAADWDNLRKGFFSDSIRYNAIEKSGALSGMKAADIGAGTGYMSEALLEKGLYVYAVDRSPEMLEILQAKFKRNGRLKCVAGEDGSLPLDQGAFDFVFANMYLHHVDNPEKSIAEMSSMLKTGGKLVISDLDRHDNDFLLTEQHDRWPGFERSDIQKWYINADLEKIKITDAGGDCCAASECGCNKAQINIFLAIGVKA